MENKLLTSKELAAHLGVSSSVFYAIIRKNKFLPAGKYYSNWYKTECPYWNEATFELLDTHPDIVNARARSKKYREAKDNRIATRDLLFQRQYPDWRMALIPACIYMLNMNRYAKYRECTRTTRTEIYDLKTQLLCTLYQKGYAIEVRRHEFKNPGKTCWGCNGDGCEDCEYTGYYREPYTENFILFKFMVNGVPFSWHQPELLVTWSIQFTNEESQSYIPDQQEKPIAMNLASLSDAKALIRFVVDKAYA